MTSHYSVVQYVPDPIADERLNVGIIAVGGDEVHVRFLHNWHRAKQFGSSDVRFLRDFAASVQQRQQLFPHESDWTFSELQTLSIEWANSIQFSAPRASVKSAADLMDELVSLYLRDEALPIQNYRDRQEALSLVVRRTKSALRVRFGKAGAGLIRTKYPLQGQMYPHTFDVVAGNSQPFFAAQTISIELPDPRRVEKDIDAAAWTLGDLLAHKAGFPAAIVALLPSGPTVDAAKQENIGRIQKVADRVKVELVTEATIDDWSSRMAALVPHAAG